MQRAEEAEARVRFLELAQEIMTADRDEWEHAHKDLKDRLLSPARARIAELERVLQTVTNLLQKALDVIAFEKRGKS
jgi:vacuolar-type H+-ATPase subunit E/Vma4